MIMKKAIILTLLSVLFQMAFGQNGDFSDMAFQRKGWYVNTGFSFGYYKYGFSGNRQIKILPTTVSLEKGISNQFSAGLYLGYAKWEYLGDYNLEFISTGARLTWHTLTGEPGWIDLDPTRWDLYISVITGVEIRVADEYLNFTGPYEKETRVIFGPVVGLKYFFNPGIGVYVEGGRGAFGYGTAGIAFRF